MSRPIELDPPVTEADHFAVEAALQLGADYVDDDATILQMPESTFMELIRRVRHGEGRKIPKSNLIP